MRKTSRVLVRIAGSLVGFLIGAYCALPVTACVAHLIPSLRQGPEEAVGLVILFVAVPVGLLIVGPLGAAIGATVTQTVLRQRSSFWIALLGAVVGTAVPVIGTVIGAVAGSGWKAKPTPSSSGTQGATSPGDTLKPQPVQAKCPFCHSTAFHVKEEAGLRRCSGCRSVLPKYVQGNR